MGRRCQTTELEIACSAEKKQPSVAVDRQPASDALDEETLRSMFADSADVIIKPFPVKDEEAIPVLLLYSEGMVDAKLMTQYVLPDLEKKLKQFKDWELLAKELDKSMEWSKVKHHAGVVKQLFAGHMLLFFHWKIAFIP